MSTLYIKLPCKALNKLDLDGLALTCSSALVEDNGTIDREVIASLTDLSTTIAKVQRVVLLIAASDVTVLQVPTPPLSAAKLKIALPNLVEEKLLGNPAECVMVAGDIADGLRTVAVIQRAWLEQISIKLMALGARHISALPAQLCLPHQADRVVAAISQQNHTSNLTMRLSEQTGLGLAISSDEAEAVIQSLCAVIPDAPITLFIPETSMPDYQRVIDSAGLQVRISPVADSWPQWIAGAGQTTLNLMTGLYGESNPKINWRTWRWALVLSGTILVVNIFALNIDWWQMKNEAKTLSTTMTQIYQARFPRESVIIDPIAQMQQKITFAKRDAGLASSDDFTILAANFGEAWSSVTAVEKPAVSKLEYRENRLFVSFKTSQISNDSALLEELRTALTSRHLSLSVTPSESGLASWQIRSSK